MGMKYNQIIVEPVYGNQNYGYDLLDELSKLRNKFETQYFLSEDENFLEIEFQDAKKMIMCTKNEEVKEFLEKALQDAETNGCGNLSFQLF